MPFKKGHRGRVRKSTGSTRASLPAKQRDESDEEMADAVPAAETPMEEVEDEAGTPAQEQEAENEEDDDDENDDDDDEPRITTIPRKRKGRPGRRSTARTEFDTPEPGGEEGSDAGTPFNKRRKGRASTGSTRGGFRGRKRVVTQDVPHVLFEGERYDVVNDEADIDDDEEGNDKVDEFGQLQGGREYRVRTFKIADRGDRLYMLSTEPARCCGFRDSYLFFTKHPKLYKVLLTEPEKMDLIQREILPNSYKGRNIGVVTARSVFREFGARIIVAGRRITDDYKVAEARADGYEEGVLADPEDRIPGTHEEYNRNRYVAWFGASDVYRTQAGAPGPDKKGIMAARKRNNVTIVNWQALHSREASKFNNRIAAARGTTHNGVYDHNTNLLFYPSSTQPTHARWALAAGETTHDTIFKSIPDVVSRNYTIVDTTYVSPPLANTGYPGSDGMITDTVAGTMGLSSIPDDLVDELPEECRRAFLEARDTELKWKQQWTSERHSALRGDLKVGFIGYPV
ncbi:hypothetical protein AMS68_000784 [Peltaster fructicola]|uniref:Chromatin structure-remodeling complex protein RSC7 n=1 Tax=Peltaster fructicola TaxID=286661 RepID=A0A6H0XKJ7_9PEZI|nr:hypothetical protein AMS68_000784 [Peltaster fructicola]